MEAISSTDNDFLLSNEEKQQRNEMYKQELLTIHQSDRYQQQVHKQRTSLPIYQMKNAIIDTIRNHAIMVISGETGSGKTTQLPLYILEDMVKS